MVENPAGNDWETLGDPYHSVKFLIPQERGGLPSLPGGESPACLAWLFASVFLSVNGVRGQGVSGLAAKLLLAVGTHGSPSLLSCAARCARPGAHASFVPLHVTPIPVLGYCNCAHPQSKNANQVAQGVSQLYKEGPLGEKEAALWYQRCQDISDGV